MGSVFVDACRRREVDHTPVWFMRQAGRYLPSYRRIRGERGILEIAKDPELASSVTVDPVRQLGVDAAIMFADIMLPLEGLGVSFKIEENLGPVVENPIRTGSQIESLREFDAEEQVPYVFETIRRAVSKLNGVPLIGFSGGPFTLAGYIIEGSPNREFLLTRRFMLSEPEAWRSLMVKLTTMVEDYLAAQIENGVAAVQLFDSWAGCLSPRDYETNVKPYTKQIFESLSGSVPRIHFCADSSALVESFATTGCDVMSVDWRLPIDHVWSRTGGMLAVQGNLDPVVPVVGGIALESAVAEILSRAAGKRGHIFNLGHGVLRDTPPENLMRIVDVVHSKTRAT